MKLAEYSSTTLYRILHKGRERDSEDTESTVYNKYKLLCNFVPFAASVEIYGK